MQIESQDRRGDLHSTSDLGAMQQRGSAPFLTHGAIPLRSIAPYSNSLCAARFSIRFCATRFRRIEVRYSNPVPAGVHVVTEPGSSLRGEPSEFRGTPSAAGGFASLLPQPPSPCS